MKLKYTFKPLTHADYYRFEQDASKNDIYYGDQLFLLLDKLDWGIDNELFSLAYSINIPDAEDPIGMVLLRKDEDYHELAYYLMNDYSDETTTIDTIKTFINCALTGILVNRNTSQNETINKIITYCGTWEGERAYVLRKIGFEYTKELVKEIYMSDIHENFEMEGYVFNNQTTTKKERTVTRKTMKFEIELDEDMIKSLEDVKENCEKDGGDWSTFVYFALMGEDLISKTDITYGEFLDFCKKRLKTNNND